MGGGILSVPDVLVSGVMSCFNRSPSCLKLNCQSVAVATAHLFGSSALQWPSRLAGSQRDVMQCRPPAVLRGQPALPLAALACRHQERGLSALRQRQAAGKTKRV